MTKTKTQTTQYLSFRDHLVELRRRLFYIVIFLGAGMGLGWAYQGQLTRILQRPLGQQLYYSDPTGGLGFILQISLFAGVVFAAPVIVHQILQFVRPVSQKISTKLVLKFVFISFVLAAAGVAFAYFISMPAALKFLLEINTEQVTALISADKYLSFVMAYLASFAFIFQLPLILLFINRITPMSGGKLMKMERPLIVMSFIAAAILTPTPDPLNQLIMALPIIVLYQVACICVLIDNRLRKVRFAPVPKQVAKNNDLAVTAPLEHSSPVATPARSAFVKQPGVLDLKTINERVARKQPSSAIFHNSNLPIRNMDVRRLKFSD